MRARGFCLTHVFLPSRVLLGNSDPTSSYAPCFPLTGCGKMLPCLHSERSFGVGAAAADCRFWYQPACWLGICARVENSREQARGEESGSKLPYSKASQDPDVATTAAQHTPRVLSLAPMWERPRLHRRLAVNLHFLGFDGQRFRLGKFSLPIRPAPKNCGARAEDARHKPDGARACDTGRRCPPRSWKPSW